MTNAFLEQFKEAMCHLGEACMAARRGGEGGREGTRKLMAQPLNSESRGLEDESATRLSKSSTGSIRGGVEEEQQSGTTVSCVNLLLYSPMQVCTNLEGVLLIMEGQLDHLPFSALSNLVLTLTKIIHDDNNHIKMEYLFSWILRVASMVRGEGEGDYWWLPAVAEILQEPTTGSPLLKYHASTMASLMTTILINWPSLSPSTHRSLCLALGHFRRDHPSHFEMHMLPVAIEMCCQVLREPDVSRLDLETGMLFELCYLQQERAQFTIWSVYAGSIFEQLGHLIQRYLPTLRLARLWPSLQMTLKMLQLLLATLTSVPIGVDPYHNNQFASLQDLYPMEIRRMFTLLLHELQNIASLSECPISLVDTEFALLVRMGRLVCGAASTGPVRLTVILSQLIENQADCQGDQLLDLIMRTARDGFFTALPPTSLRPLLLPSSPLMRLRARQIDQDPSKWQQVFDLIVKDTPNLAPILIESFLNELEGVAEAISLKGEWSGEIEKGSVINKTLEGTTSMSSDSLRNAIESSCSSITLTSARLKAIDDGPFGAHSKAPPQSFNLQLIMQDLATLSMLIDPQEGASFSLPGPIVIQACRLFVRLFNVGNCALPSASQTIHNLLAILLVHCLCLKGKRKETNADCKLLNGQIEAVLQAFILDNQQVELESQMIVALCQLALVGTFEMHFLEALAMGALVRFNRLMDHKVIYCMLELFKRVLPNGALQRSPLLREYCMINLDTTRIEIRRLAIEVLAFLIRSKEDLRPPTRTISCLATTKEGAISAEIQQKYFKDFLLLGIISPSEEEVREWILQEMQSCHPEGACKLFRGRIIAQLIGSSKDLALMERLARLLRNATDGAIVSLRTREAYDLLLTYCLLVRSGHWTFLSTGTSSSKAFDAWLGHIAIDLLTCCLRLERYEDLVLLVMDLRIHRISLLLNEDLLAPAIEYFWSSGCSDIAWMLLGWLGGVERGSIAVKVFHVLISKGPPSALQALLASVHGKSPARVTSLLRFVLVELAILLEESAALEALFSWCDTHMTVLCDPILVVKDGLLDGISDWKELERHQLAFRHRLILSLRGGRLDWCKEETLTRLAELHSGRRSFEDLLLLYSYLSRDDHKVILDDLAHLPFLLHQTGSVQGSHLMGKTHWQDEKSIRVMREFNNKYQHAGETPSISNKIDQIQGFLSILGQLPSITPLEQQQHALLRALSNTPPVILVFLLPQILYAAQSWPADLHSTLVDGLEGILFQYREVFFFHLYPLLKGEDLMAKGSLEGRLWERLEQAESLFVENSKLFCKLLQRLSIDSEQVLIGSSVRLLRRLREVAREEDLQDVLSFELEQVKEYQRDLERKELLLELHTQYQVDFDEYYQCLSQMVTMGRDGLAHGTDQLVGKAKNLLHRISQLLNEEIRFRLSTTCPELCQLIESKAIHLPGLFSISPEGALHYDGFFALDRVHDEAIMLPSTTRPVLLAFDSQQSSGRRRYLYKGRDGQGNDLLANQFWLLLAGINGEKTEDGGGFQVIATGSTSGLVGWVEDAQPILSLLRGFPDDVQLPTVEQYKYQQALLRRKEGGAEKGAQMERRQRRIFEAFLLHTPPFLLWDWLMRGCLEGGEWLEKWQRSVYSLAQGSIVGYILGLGDRHLGNMLLKEDGRIVHVDYSVCFGKGKCLKIPERVPFRLTGIFSSALGGEEGKGNGEDGINRRTIRLLRGPFGIEMRRTLGRIRKYGGLFWHLLQPAAQGILSEQIMRDGRSPEKLQKELQMQELRERLLPSSETDLDEEIRFLIAEAMDVKELARMYEGWMAWI